MITLLLIFVNSAPSVTSSFETNPDTWDENAVIAGVVTASRLVEEKLVDRQGREYTRRVQAVSVNVEAVVFSRFVVPTRIETCYYQRGPGSPLYLLDEPKVGQKAIMVISRFKFSSHYRIAPRDRWRVSGDRGLSFMPSSLPVAFVDRFDENVLNSVAARIRELADDRSADLPATNEKIDVEVVVEAGERPENPLIHVTVSSEKPRDLFVGTFTSNFGVYVRGPADPVTPKVRPEVWMNPETSLMANAPLTMLRITKSEPYKQSFRLSDYFDTSDEKVFPSGNYQINVKFFAWEATEQGWIEQPVDSGPVRFRIKR